MSPFCACSLFFSESDGLRSMQESKVLHLFAWNGKFVVPFMRLIRENFQQDRHKFVIYGNYSTDEVPAASDTLKYPKLFSYLIPLCNALNAADRIILHGLFNTRLVLILAFQPWLLKRCYWVIWGGDLYLHQAQRRDWHWHISEYLRRLVIKRIGHLVSFIEGDAELARKWYGARGRYVECLVYPTNLYQELPVRRVAHPGINILIGNSADPSNNQSEILERLKNFDGEGITIYTPLSYGDREHAEEVIRIGKKYFGEKFKPLTDFLPYEEYLEFLGSIDIAIFNHRRQQAMGNTITLLGLGKKVFLRRDTTSWKMLARNGFDVFDVLSLELTRLDEGSRMRNRKLVREKFSKQRLIAQLRQIFGDC